jgi:hypothetical protein
MREMFVGEWEMDKNSRIFGCDTVQFGVCLPKFRKMMVVLKLRCTLTIPE